jgi:hypothetical protein
MSRKLVLLSSYRLPTQSTAYYADEEVAAFLNGWSALWHPLALHGADEAPHIASPYDHEQPQPGHVYALPDNPSVALPADWQEKARAGGAVFFESTADRARTFANLVAALAPPDAGEAARKLASLPPERVGPFLGVGFGQLQLEALFEAMSHDNVLAAPEMWDDLTQAVNALLGEDPDGAGPHLQSAADRLLAGREVVYPVTVHVVDLALADPDRLDAPWPASLGRGLPCNLVACSALLERLASEQPDRLAELRERAAGELAEVCGGDYLEREDALLPVESQLWNLLKGQAVYQELLGQEVRVFGRRRFGFHPQLPLLLHAVGISRALLLVFDESVVPAHRSPVVSWPSLDGKQVDSFARTPLPADSPQTYFHLAYHLHQTIMQDQSATLALLHKGAPASAWYGDWLELTRLAPALGKWTTLSNYFSDVLTGDYASSATPDDFQDEYLVERTGSPANPDNPDAPRARPTPFPVSGFARQVRLRRHLDTAWGLAALLRGLGGKVEDSGVSFETELARLEDGFESDGAFPAEEISAAQDRAARALAHRLVARGRADNPGLLVLNPCSFARRVALEVEGVTGPLATGGPLKACQVDGTTARVVVEVPALGFAWVPRTPAGSPPPPSRMRLADQHAVRNEFFEAEVDPQTGGLRGIKDQRTRVSRLAQQLVFNPGSSMRARQVQVTSAGPALGEVVSEGDLLDEQGQVLATFRQRFRAWLGRPMLELRVELVPARPPEGYPWHAYYGARFAWRDERATLLRGVNGCVAPTSHTRPQTPEFLEVRVGSQNTVIFPGGLPFHQRHGGRMLDVLLVVEGEAAREFDLGVSLDREHPMQTALGVVSPVAVVPTDRGPPHVGATGWLFHLDAPNLLLTTLRPAPGGADGVTARLLEVSGFGGPAELRCVRDPARASLQDARGTALLEAPTQGDAVQLDVNPNDLVHVRVDFS